MKSNISTNFHLTVIGSFKLKIFLSFVYFNEVCVVYKNLKFSIFKMFNDFILKVKKLNVQPTNMDFGFYTISSIFKNTN
jgi:hypothetical protein